MTKDDRNKLMEFFNALPEEMLISLKEDVRNPDVIERWVSTLDLQRVIPIFAMQGDAIVADATLHLDQYGWMRHVGEIRLVIAQKMRYKGLGTLLVKELFHLAIKKGLDKIIVELMDNQIKAIKSLERLGFKQDAILRDQVIDFKGNKHNLIIMSNYLSELWHSLEDMILDAEFAKDFYH